MGVWDVLCVSGACRVYGDVGCMEFGCVKQLPRMNEHVSCMNEHTNNKWHGVNVGPVYQISRRTEHINEYTTCMTEYMN